MVPVTSMISQVMNRTIVQPPQTSSPETMAAGMTRINRKSTASRFSGPGGGIATRTG